MRFTWVFTVAALTIKGAAPGTQVSLDQKAIGTVGADGGFSQSNIGPGNHQVELVEPIEMLFIEHPGHDPMHGQR